MTTVRQQLLAMVERAAARHPDVANPKELVPEILEEMQGAEAEFLEALLPAAVIDLLRQRARGERQKAKTPDELWQAFLQERVFTSGRGYVFGAETTGEELKQAAIRRRRFAGALDRRAWQYAEVSEAVQSAGVARAGDLNASRGGLLLEELEVRVATVRHQRMTDARRASALTAAQSHLESLQDMRSRGESPVVLFLRAHRDELLGLLDDALVGLGRGLKSDRALEEGFRGAG